MTAISNPKAVPDELLQSWRSVQQNFFFPIYDKKSQFLYPFCQVVAGLCAFGIEQQQVVDGGGSTDSGDKIESSASSASSATSATSASSALSIITKKKEIESWVFASELDHESWKVLTRKDMNLREVALRYNAEIKVKGAVQSGSSQLSTAGDPTGRSSISGTGTGAKDRKTSHRKKHQR